MAFLFLVNRRHGTDKRTDKRTDGVQRFVRHPREGHIIAEMIVKGHYLRVSVLHPTALQQQFFVSSEHHC